VLLSIKEQLLAIRHDIYGEKMIIVEDQNEEISYQEHVANINAQAIVSGEKKHADKLAAAAAAAKESTDVAIRQCKNNIYCKYIIFNSYIFHFSDYPFNGISNCSVSSKKGSRDDG
jgi:hypothetical protein